MAELEEPEDASYNRICSNTPSSTWKAHPLTVLSLPYRWERVHTSLEYTCGLNVCKNKTSQRMNSPWSHSSLALWRSICDQDQEWKKMEWESILLQSMRPQHFASNKEEAICLIILGEPQSKHEPTAPPSMDLAGPGYQPSNHTSTENLPILATFRKTCFHCSKSLTYEDDGNANNIPDYRKTDGINLILFCPDLFHSKGVLEWVGLLWLFVGLYFSVAYLFEHSRGKF